MVDDSSLMFLHCIYLVLCIFVYKNVIWTDIEKIQWKMEQPVLFFFSSILEACLTIVHSETFKKLLYFRGLIEKYRSQMTIFLFCQETTHISLYPL